MKLIIDIHEEDYKALNKVGNNGLEFNDTLGGRVYRAVANGTPLPKGHDRLVEAREVIKALFNKQTIDDVPTVVEADESEAEV